MESSEDSRISGLLEFLRYAGKLKETKRSGWLTMRVASGDEAESVADHVFRTALMALAVGDAMNSERGGAEKLDVGKLTKLVLLHEVGESVIGDWDHVKKRQHGADNKKRLEREAVVKIVSTLPPAMADEYLKLFDEFEDGKSEEAKLAKAFDVLERMMQAAHYAKKTGNSDIKIIFDDGLNPENKSIENFQFLKKMRAALEKEMSEG
ncbi:MAG: HD domain-containing protein [Candidatus Aenigmarchaeota archaeon]|nr:HD domain-containing protein [Candidatus Aenigmarchaeota archaeon]